MKTNELIKVLKEFPNYTVLSDSGWEVSATDIGTVYVSKKIKTVVLKQDFHDQKDDVDDLNEQFSVDDFVLVYQTKEIEND